MALLTVEGAAEAAGTTHTRIYAAIRRGELVPVKGMARGPKCKLLRESEVMAWAAKPASKGGRPRKVSNAS